MSCLLGLKMDGSVSVRRTHTWHQLDARATCETFIEGQHGEGAGFAGGLPDEVVGRVGRPRFERGIRSTHNRVVLDRHASGTDEPAKRSGDGRQQRSCQTTSSSESALGDGPLDDLQ